MNNAETIRRNLGEITDPNIKVENNISLFEFAIDNDWNDNEIDFLISKKPSLLNADNSQNLLIKYSKKKYHELLGKLVSISNDTEISEFVNDNRNPALFYIARSNNLSGLKEALDISQKSTCTNKYGQNILSFYFKYSDHIRKSVLVHIIDTIKNEIGAGNFDEFINSRDQFGQTAFSNLTMRTINEKNKEKKEKLLLFLPYLKSEGADVNLSDSARITPLLWTAIEDDEVTFKKLMSLGADLTKESVDGDSCLQYALMRENEDIIWGCIDNTAQIPVKIKNINKHPIFEALFLGDRFTTLCIATQMADSIDLSNPSDDNHTLLIYAIKHASTITVSDLIELGADVNKKNNHGLTPLMYCIFNFKKDPDEYSEIIKILIKAGADIEAVNNNCDNVIDLAKSKGLEAQVGTLLFHNNIKHLADAFYDGDKDKAEKIALSVGGSTLDKMYEKDIKDSNAYEILESKIAIENEKEIKLKVANIDEGKRLISRNIAQHIPILLGVGAISEKILLDNNSNYTLATIAIGCSALNYMLSFSSADREKMSLAVTSMIEIIDEKILYPSIEKYIKLSFIKQDIFDAIDIKWRGIKNSLISFKNLLTPSRRNNENSSDNINLNISDNNDGLIENDNSISKSDLVKIINEMRKYNDNDIVNDQTILNSILSSVNDDNNNDAIHAREFKRSRVNNQRTNTM